MPGTTSRGYPYPLTTEPADGAPQIEALARAIDTDITANTSQAFGFYLSSTPQSNIPANTYTRLTGVPATGVNAPVMRGGVTHDSAGMLTLPKAGRYSITVSLTWGWYAGAFTSQFGWGDASGVIAVMGGIAQSQPNTTVSAGSGIGIYAAAANQKVALWVSQQYANHPINVYRITVQWVGT